MNLGKNPSRKVFLTTSDNIIYACVVLEIELIIACICAVIGHRWCVFPPIDVYFITCGLMRSTFLQYRGTKNIIYLFYKAEKP